MKPGLAIDWLRPRMGLLPLLFVPSIVCSQAPQPAPFPVSPVPLSTPYAARGTPTAGIPLKEGAASVAPTPKREPPLVTAGPMVGHVWESGAKIWVQIDRPAIVSLEVRKAGQEPWQAVKWKDGRDRYRRLWPDTALSGILSVEDLQPATYYEYRLTTRDGPLAAAGDQSFKTPVAPGQPEDFRLAYGSCASTWGKDPNQPIWPAIDRLRPEMFLFLGDNVYYERDPQEWAHPDMMWMRYKQGRSIPLLQPLLRHTACYAIWDDHDYGPDDSDKLYNDKDLSLYIFKTYWANPGFATDGMPGVWYRFTRGQVEFFMLDGRYYRDPEDAANDEFKTQLGAVQRAWLEKVLKASKATFKIIVTGGQVLARYHDFESFDEYRYERQWLINVIRDNHISGVVFLTGDRHLGEILRWKQPDAPYPLWEFTSSPLAAGLSGEPPPDDQVPDRLPGSIVMAENFGEVVFEGMGTPEAKLTFHHRGVDGQPVGQTVELKARELQ